MVFSPLMSVIVQTLQFNFYTQSRVEWIPEISAITENPPQPAPSPSPGDGQIHPSDGPEHLTAHAETPQAHGRTLNGLTPMAESPPSSEVRCQANTCLAPHFRRWAPEYLAMHGQAMSDRQKNMLQKILRCRLPAPGDGLCRRFGASTCWPLVFIFGFEREIFRVTDDLHFAVC